MKQGMTRRDFFSNSVKSTAGVLVTPRLETILKILTPMMAFLDSSCTYNVDWKSEPFTINKFDKWFRYNKLYNSVNPNLRLPHHGGKHPTFRSNVYGMVPGGRPTPGIGYNVPNGAMMIAAAPGWVSNVKELRTGRAGGIMVEVVHTPELYAIRGYISYYAHLAHPYVGEGQFVRRGDAIGVVTEHREYAKLLFMEGGHYGRWVDPDNYGRQHSYMDYWDGSDSKSDMSDLELIAARSKKQKAILKYFEDARADCRDDPLYDPVFAKVHGSNRAYWSVVEQYRYHECLYDIKPDIFPDVSKNECDALRKEFYENQPIVLTLPLTKPG